tara:strand:+ start:67 stop:225 length:159 start_codon:yes stop_codon:yes gene_type:complete
MAFIAFIAFIAFAIFEEGKCEVWLRQESYFYHLSRNRNSLSVFLQTRVEYFH